MLIHLVSPFCDEWAFCDWPGDEDNGLDLTNDIDIVTCGTCLALLRTFESMIDPLEVAVIRRHRDMLDAKIEN